MRNLETDKPELAEKLNTLLAIELLTAGDAYNMPKVLPVPAEVYDEFQIWLWGTTLTTTTKWKTMILQRQVTH